MAQLISLVVLLALLVGVGVPLWILEPRQIASHVSVSWELDCPAGTIVEYKRAPAISSRPGWTCPIRVTVTNDGSHAVSLTGFASPIMGSEAPGRM